MEKKICTNINLTVSPILVLFCLSSVVKNTILGSHWSCVKDNIILCLQKSYLIKKLKKIINKFLEKIKKKVSKSSCLEIFVYIQMVRREEREHRSHDECTNKRFSHVKRIFQKQPLNHSAYSYLFDQPSEK